MITKGVQAICAIFLGAMMLAPALQINAEQERAADIIFRVSNFSDGKAEKIISLTGSGSDRSTSIAIPNGARVISATMNITGLPTTDGGTDYPGNITVDAGNDGTLEYAFRGTGYGQMGYQTLFSTGANSLNVSLPLNGGTNATPSVRLPKNAVVTSTKMDVKGGGGRVLVIYADNDASSVNNIVTKLKAFPGDIIVVDTFNGNQGTPTLDLLRGYSSCLVYCMGYSGMTGYSTWNNNAALGDVLADYVDYGGGVVTTGLCWATSYGNIAGRFASGGYYAMPMGSLYGGSNVVIQSILLPAHPIMNNVVSISYDGSSSLLYFPSTAAVNGGQVVFTWNAGPSIGACVLTRPNGVNRVDLMMNPWSNTINRASYGVGYNGNGDILMKNSLIWTGGSGYGNYSVDFAKDGSINWASPNLNGTESVPDFSSDFNSYLATALPNGTDAYGNEYVDVPIAVRSNTSGRLSLLNLSIAYQWTARVDANPTSGSLTEGLNAVIPTNYDMKSTNIPLVISSTRAGKVKLSSLRIEYIPPVHPAIITSRTPEDAVVVMDENTTSEFCITADDPYNYPMNISWTVNGRTVMKNQFNMSWYADFDANGTYNVTVSVDNELQKVATSWQVIVRNVNRKPVIDSFSPEKKFEMDENSSATFEISASDPDNNAISLTWYLDGKRVLSEETIYDYKTTYASAGKHELKVTVLDVLGASTTFSWEITVKEVNAGPIIADSSPAGDESVMPENSARKFSVVDISPDLDKQFITWSLDGNNTGITGRSYEYLANFDSAGTHVIQADVTDGKLAERRVWNVIVTDVNRAPLAVILSPAAKAEFMFGADIVLDGSTSSDPDGDSLTMTWSEAGKPLGTGSSLTTKLSKGKHIITLGVDDGKKSGNATAQVELYVRYIDFKGTITVDAAAPTEGKKLVVTVKLTNRGDGSADELPVSFSVDGTEVTTTIIETIEPDAEFPLEFQWKAVKGDHKLEVTVNGQAFSKTVSVAKPAVTTTQTDSDMLVPAIAIAVVLAIAAVAAVMVLGARKKRAGLQETYDEGYQDQRVEEQYQPQEEEPSPEPEPEAPPMTEEQQAREAIDNAERVLADAEGAGLDTSKSRQSLKIARNFLDMGKYQKAMLYCKMAEDNLA